MLTAVSPQATHLHAGKRSLTIMKPWRRNDVPAKAGLNMFSSEHHLVCMDHLKFFPSVNAMTGGEEDAEVWERMLRSAAYGGDLKGKQKVVLEEYH
ncbi:hypothetical protein GW17_00022715 [Ensete ventricosum]|nr:hypothetical protein GW17_00022715 [Ensete ventricosum]